MGKQIFDRIKKTTSILLAVLLVVSLIASAGAACTNTATTTTTATTPAAPTTPSSATNSNTLSLSDLGTLLASLLQGMGYNLDLSNSGDSSSLSSSFPSSLLNV